MRTNLPLKSIRKRLVHQIVGLVMGATLLVAMSSSFMQWHQLKAQVQKELNEESRQLLTQIELRVDYLVESASQFAQSSHVTNSFIDEGGRDRYLPVAVSEFASREDIASVTTVDYRGIPIQPNRSGLMALQVEIKKALALGVPSLVSASPGVIYAVEPVKYYGTTQGAVLVELNFESLLNKTLAPFRGEFASLSLGGVAVRANQEKPGDLLVASQAAPSDLPHLHGLGARLELGISNASVRAQVGSALLKTLLICFILVLFSVKFAWRVGGRLAAPILELSARVDAKQYPCSPLGTQDELDLLATSFDAQTSELWAAQSELEERVDRRTRELALRTEELESSNRDLDDFAQIASQDLKEPLRGMHNYSQFLMDDYGDVLEEGGRHQLETISRLAQRMEGLIDTLLYFSRVGRNDLAVEEQDLNEIAKDVAESLVVGLEEKQVEIRVPRRLPLVRCDGVRVAEVYRNLMSNALKFNDKPGPFIELGYAESVPVGAPEGASPQTCFYVRDNGLGIPQHHRESIFRIFKRLHGRDEFGGGHGAGLTIVKKIIERHQGRLWVQSTLGEGATFWFTLGREDLPAPPTGREPESGVSSSAGADILSVG